MRNQELSSLDISQIQRRVYDESKDATRVYLVGGGVDINPEDIKNALKDGISQVKFPQISVSEQKQIELKEIQVPVIIKEIELKEIEKPVVIKEIEISYVDKPIFIKEQVVEKIEVPVIIKETELKTIEIVKTVELTISKPMLYYMVTQTIVVLGLLIHNLIKH